MQRIPFTVQIWASENEDPLRRPGRHSLFQAIPNFSSSIPAVQHPCLKRKAAITLFDLYHAYPLFHLPNLFSLSVICRRRNQMHRVSQDALDLLKMPQLQLIFMGPINPSWLNLPCTYWSFSQIKHLHISNGHFSGISSHPAAGESDCYM